ncbi:MAG TPA: non-homologous end-joining DNA ligase [Myxococcota bacterium]|nr:non-homologous end-joining DNA ligase [Myxococcota bacterium]
MKKRSRLATYRTKRDFERTPEPTGRPARRKRAKGLRYVIQKHAARSLHYDFRLEHEGVLWSWSVPKGPSLAPADRRLAVRTEDHPLEYADFEGVIPQGEYGGGTVMVWDTGTWQPEGDAADAMKKGRLTFELMGRKLHGRWHLVRTRLSGGKRENWLLFKGRDDAADDAADVLRDEPDSAASGRSLEQIGSARGRVWHSNRKEKDVKGEKGRPTTLKDRIAARAAARPKKKATAAKTKATTKKTAAAALPDLLRELPVGFRFTNLEKVLYPEEGITKGQVIAYYAVVAEWLLPYIEGRPLTLLRCPDGYRHCFFQKHAREGVPDSIERVQVREESGKREPYMVVRDRAGLLAAPQLGALELHTWMSRVEDVEHPDELVFDIDPDVGLGWKQVVAAAQELRARLEAEGLTSFVKTTGGKGLHVVAPVQPRRTWDEHLAFALEIVQAMEGDAPDRYTTNARKALRKGRMFLDYLRNGRGATAVAPYSTRARAGATVATPLSWSELERGVDPQDFTLTSVPKRIASLRADPWADYAKLRQSIPKRRG